MDLETTSLVAKVSAPSLLKLKLNTNQDYATVATSAADIAAFKTNGGAFEKENYLPENYIISSPDLKSFADTNVELSSSSNFCGGRFDNHSHSHSEYLADCHLEQYCRDEANLIDSALIDKDYRQVRLNSGGDNIDDVLKFQNPQSILEDNSQLVDPQDKADFTALDELLNIAEIEPHFIVASGYNAATTAAAVATDPSSTRNAAVADENRIDSTAADMGIENTWNEDFAVPSTSTFPLPLPLPLPAPPETSNFGDFSNCNNFDSVEHGSYTSDLEALFSTNETEVDVTDDTAEGGVCGLRNLGNTCFMSTGIQCLAATKSLVQFFINGLTPARHLDENSLTTQFTELLQKMWSGRYSVVHPMKFKQALGAYHSQFKDCSQHDCQEFLALLLDALHQQLVSMPKLAVENGDEFTFKEKMDVGMDYLSSVDLNSKKELNQYTNITGGEDLCGNSENNNNSNFDNNENCDSSNIINNNSNNNNNDGEEAYNGDMNRNCTSNEAEPIKFVATMIAANSGSMHSADDMDELVYHISTNYDANVNANDHVDGDRIDGNNDGSSKGNSDSHDMVRQFLEVAGASGSIDARCSIKENGKLDYMKDIFKEAKTSNVNVLVAETEANNEICFDSEKFPKKERRRNIAETNYYDMYPNVTNVIHKDSANYFKDESNFGDSSDLKRLKVNRLNEEKNCFADNQLYSNEPLEKNVRIENERKLKVCNVNVKPSKEDSSSGSAMDLEEEPEDSLGGIEEAEMRTIEDSDEMAQTSDEDLLTADELEAEKHWEKHVLDNRSIIFDSFQGQFKNTVVCSACNFKSITYEPFMYLSVPLPHAIEKQLCVTFVSAKPDPPVQYLLTLTKQDEVSKIKQHLLKLMPDKLEHPLVIGEVFDYHIAKILDDNYQVRYLDDVNRSIYAFEQIFVAPASKNDSDFRTGNQPNRSSDADESINSVSVTCSICLEEKESDIRRHKECECILCDVCIQTYAHHSGDKKIKCPICRSEVVPDKDLVPIEQSDMKPNMRLLNVPVVFRVDKVGDGNNNQKVVKLFGHPALLKLPSQLSGEELYRVISTLHSYQQPFKLILVNGQGSLCSRCMFNQHCRGCAVPREGHISLRTDDTLAVTFTDDVIQINEIRHSSMSLQRSHKTLSLYDCVQAFSQSEILDEFNPWYCPRCEKNQCATKTLSVWRFPNYLIVYLKRFVFHECASIKLEDKVMFPLHDFNFNKKKESSYDLYACVCHTGGVSVGHYIAYTQHPLTSEWHCFNDENVSKQKPQEEEYCNAYILFYKKKNIEL